MRSLLILAVVIATYVLIPRAVSQIHPGSTIFKQKCAECHGLDGQGTASGYDHPLAGDLSLDALAQLIQQTMPERDPNDCLDVEARQVAEYVFNEFYSLDARHRKGLAAKPRVQLARLTVPQYRNVIADLILRFTPVPKQLVTENSVDPDRPRGLFGQYYQSDGMNKAEKKLMERVDQRIDFDFGEGSPAERITPDQFLIVWNGSIDVPESGIYQFRLSTQNGARLFLNRDPENLLGKLRDDSSAPLQTALIDAWVSSGQMRHQTAKILLLGGRRYSLKLEFFKYKEKTSSITLQWKPPHGIWSVLDESNLINEIVQRTLVVDTPFPADDQSLGYERGSSISQQWLDATSETAVAVADEVVGRLPILAGFDYRKPEYRDRLRDWIIEFAETAYRRPLTATEVQRFRDEFLPNGENPDAAVRRSVVFILQSPYFLYTDLAAPAGISRQHVVASRLAAALWDSLPDPPLSRAAENGELHTRQQVRLQAQRMLADPRTQTKVRSFFEHWLDFDSREISKDREMFPEFDEAVVADLRRSLDLFIEQIVWNSRSDYRQLLLADYLVLNDRLRQIYAPDTDSITTEIPESSNNESPGHDPYMAGFQNVTLVAGRRAGILTHPYLLSSLAYANNTSPIHRGVFLTRKIVGRELKPPPVAVVFENDKFPSDLTLREKITQLTQSSACMSCHSVINPLGFALEHYDAIGRFRTRDGNEPVNTISDYPAGNGQTLTITSARDIAEFAAASQSAQTSFVTHLFQYLVRQNPRAYGSDTIEKLRAGFAENNFNIQSLIVEIATISSI